MVATPTSVPRRQSRGVPTQNVMNVSDLARENRASGVPLATVAAALRGELKRFLGRLLRELKHVLTADGDLSLPWRVSCFE
jgi:hypothetical protein